MADIVSTQTSYTLAVDQVLTVSAPQDGVSNGVVFSDPSNAGGIASQNVGLGGSVTFGPYSASALFLVQPDAGTLLVTVTNSVKNMVAIGAPIDVVEMFGSGAPAASLGAGLANTGSRYTDTAAGQLYLNGGTKAAPAWKLVTRAP